MEEYEPTQDTLAAIAARHGHTAESVRPALSGVANRAYLIGDGLVLRIPRTPRFLADLVKEASVIPAARRLGVRTPEVVTFDDTCAEVDVPYMVLDRVRGADLARLDLPAHQAERVHRQVGRELARLHRLPPTPEDGLSAVPRGEPPGDPRVLLDRLLADGWIDAEAARWLTGWFDVLSPYVPAEPPMVLVHGDVAPQNLLASEAALTGIVDWGDAHWADPAVEFAKMPLSAVSAMLGGYSEEDGSGGCWEARVLRVHLAWALGRLADPVPRPGERHWTAPPAGRLLGLLRFFTENPPSPWAELV
ncbi:aminoglycoside phosphotransferase family protein [Nonomuraea sp. KC401]|uniref:phosphotransferase family protein n=1 Tax=unclassified Nonomuraea TaxID=2593643 RepID=UPI0010FDD336|nr:MULTISPECIES: aminoglycoside phosphotransferase family protein [unclassified Nonomuraea]NBE93198.1 phosphotransferase [Nonomuraea sp. K271]TLF82827.1 aminoglycoside phosphotransferase family protein [Nonomuraea sp. KC401]